jgi:O-methyltransferase
VIHKGWFNELSPKDVPKQIAFAFLDGDFYESIHTSLKLVWPRMVSGGIICIDDYKRDALPGVERAVSDFFGKDIKVTKKANIGFLVKA